MFKSPLIQDLQARGLIAQTTDASALDELLAKGQVTLYCGFDPTADSLHLGHLVPVLVLKRFQQAGHKPIALVGGATGMIGDPSFKATERKLNTPEVIAGWVDKIRGQVAPFLSFDGPNAAIMANNYDWFGGMGALEFLRDIGKHFSVNAMIKKEAVQQRISRDDQGISYTEFSYSLLQGYDFAELNRRHGCVLQIGGSDQWGNITAGTELVRRISGQEVFGMTFPLVCDSTGKKFGKSEGNAVWLDAKKTSPFQFYQFWINLPDAGIEKYLRAYTFLPLAEIEALMELHRRNPGERQAQETLARLVTEIVHGPAATAQAAAATDALFGDTPFAELARDARAVALAEAPSVTLSRKELGDGISLAETLVAGGLATSKSDARRLIEGKGITLGGFPIENPEQKLFLGDLPDGFSLVRKGKQGVLVLVLK